MSLDQSEAGRDDTARAVGLWEQRWSAVLLDARPQALTAEELIGASEELSLEEEPNGPAIYRVGFLAALLYAVRAYSRSSKEDLGWFLQRVEELISFREEELSSSSREGMDEILMALIEQLEQVEPATEEQIDGMRLPLTADRRALARSLEALEW